MYEVKIRYARVTEEEKVKMVNEPYLFDALSFTEAEARATQYATPFAGEHLDITAIRKVNYEEIFHSNLKCDDKWFAIKVVFKTSDDKGKEKRNTYFILVQSESTSKAEATYRAAMKDSSIDYEILSVSETRIMDVVLIQVGI